VDTLVPRQENFYDPSTFIYCMQVKKKLSDVSFEKKGYLFLDKKNFEPVDIVNFTSIQKRAFLSF
jgi:hypothetical protein